MALATSLVSQNFLSIWKTPQTGSHFSLPPTTALETSGDHTQPELIYRIHSNIPSADKSRAMHLVIIRIAPLLVAYVQRFGCTRCLKMLYSNVDNGFVHSLHLFHEWMTDLNHVGIADNIYTEGLSQSFFSAVIPLEPK